MDMVDMPHKPTEAHLKLKLEQMRELCQTFRERVASERRAHRETRIRLKKAIEELTVLKGERGNA